MGLHGIAETLRDFDLHPAEREMLECELGLEGDLFSAVEDGDLETVRYLLDSGMSPNMMDSTTRCTVICTAVMTRHLDIAKLARAYGADLAAFYEHEPADATPSDELLRYANDRARYDDIRDPRNRSGKAVLEWLQSRPPKDRSTAPPVGEPWDYNLDKVRPDVEKWKRLKEAFEAIPSEELARSVREYD